MSKHAFSRAFEKMFEWLDKIIEDDGHFVDDALCHDGIFDTREIMKLTVSEQKKIPMVAFNARGGAIERFTDLPPDD